MVNNKGYSNDFLSRLKSSCNIVTVISRYVPLTRKGRTYWGCCPFHHENTPSFCVYDNEGNYHCYGCGASGDVISFVQKLEGFDFMQAVKTLADSVNLPVPEFMGDESLVKKRKERERLVYICTETAKYYHKQLLQPCGKIARDYLDKRKIEQSTITKMGLGYSPNWQGLIDHLKSLKITNQEMLNSGVANEKDGRLYDVMAERLIFPILNNVGKVVGFSGRALKDGSFAKYKNTQTTEIFNKSSILFNVNNLRKARVENRNYAILVEGQIDVVSLYQAGFTNAIATLGTAFNEHHVETISKFVDSLYICFDGDGAGKKATEKSLDVLKDSNFNIKVVSMPEKLDPDDYIKKFGADSFEKLIEEAKSVREFKVLSLADKFDLKDKIQVAKFSQQALEMISTFKNVTERDLFLKIVAQKCNLNEETLKSQLNKLVMKKQNVSNKVIEKTSEEINKNKLLQAEIFVLACRLYKKSFAKNVKSSLFENTFNNSFNQYLLDNNPIVSQVLDDYDLDANDILNKIVNYNFMLLKNEEMEYKGCLKQLELRELMKKQALIKEKLLVAPKTEQYVLLTQLQQTIKEIQDKKSEE